MADITLLKWRMHVLSVLIAGIASLIFKTFFQRIFHGLGSTSLSA